MTAAAKPKSYGHYWFYLHVQIEGRREGETAVVRYCSCGKRQMAFASDWKAVPKSYNLSWAEAEMRAK